MQIISPQYQELFSQHHTRAKDGDIESQFKLGELYERGKGVTENKKLAEFWYAKAAEKKHPLAILNLNWLRLNKEGSDIFDTVQEVC